MLDLFATEPHFVAHLAPVWDALPAEARGRFVVPDHLADHVASHGIATGVTGASLSRLPDRPVLVASFGDLHRATKAGRHRIALLEHGYGQSYAGDPIRPVAAHSSYPGGRQRGAVSLFLSPNEHAAARDKSAYRGASVVIVGSPKLASLPGREGRRGEPVIAVSTHFDAVVAPETRSAFAQYRDAIAALARVHHVIGHGHPRIIDRLAPWYERHGIEVVRDFRDVLRRADLYVCDNSSTLYEFASTGRPVVVLNASFYRAGISHGLRFWDAADVGIQVWHPPELSRAVTEALADSAERQAARQRALGIVYAARRDPAAAAADALIVWLADQVEAAA